MTPRSSGTSSPGQHHPHRLHPAGPSGGSGLPRSLPHRAQPRSGWPVSGVGPAASGAREQGRRRHHLALLDWRALPELKTKTRMGLCEQRWVTGWEKSWWMMSQSRCCSSNWHFQLILIGKKADSEGHMLKKWETSHPRLGQQARRFPACRTIKENSTPIVTGESHRVKHEMKGTSSRRFPLGQPG